MNDNLKSCIIERFGWGKMDTDALKDALNNVVFEVKKVRILLEELYGREVPIEEAFNYYIKRCREEGLK